MPDTFVIAMSERLRTAEAQRRTTPCLMNSTASDTSRLCIPPVTLFLSLVGHRLRLQDNTGGFSYLHTSSSRLPPARSLMEPVTWATWATIFPRARLVIMSLFAGNRDPTAFGRPDEFLSERWLDGRKGRTDLFGEGGDKLGVPHWTYGTGRRVCPGIDMAPTAVSTRHLYFCCISSPGSDKVLERRRRRRRSSSFLPSVLSVSARSKWTPLPTPRRPRRPRPFRGPPVSCCTVAILKVFAPGSHLQTVELS